MWPRVDAVADVIEKSIGATATTAHTSMAGVRIIFDALVVVSDVSIGVGAAFMVNWLNINISIVAVVVGDGSWHKRWRMTCHINGKRRMSRMPASIAAANRRQDSFSSRVQAQHRRTSMGHTANGRMRMHLQSEMHCTDVAMLGKERKRRRLSGNGCGSTLDGAFVSLQRLAVIHTTVTQVRLMPQAPPPLSSFPAHSPLQGEGGGHSRSSHVLTPLLFPPRAPSLRSMLLHFVPIVN